MMGEEGKTWKTSTRRQTSMSNSCGVAISDFIQHVIVVLLIVFCLVVSEEN